MFCVRPGNVHEIRSGITSCDKIARIFDAKNNTVEFLLVYYTGHTLEDKQLLVKCLQDVSMRRLVCIIDCCRADEVQLPDKKNCSRVVLRSSEGRAKASPTAGSTFTRYYVAGLRSTRKCPCPHGVDCKLLQQFREKSLASGFVTLTNLFDYAREHMKDQKPRMDVNSYTNTDNHVLAFFNREPIVYTLQLEHRNEHFLDVEIEEQKIDFNKSFDDIREQLIQEILPVLQSQGLYVHVFSFL